MKTSKNPNAVALGKLGGRPRKEDLLLGCSEKVKARFASFVSAPNERGCMNWLGCPGVKRYGKFRYLRVDIQINRAAWVLAKGTPIPRPFFVCHICDNTKCVNPEHLFLGTQSDNMQDAFKKGRLIPPNPEKAPPGKRRPGRNASKLTEADIPVIREMRAKGEKLRVIAQRFGVVHGTISDIIFGRLWKGV